MCLKPMDSPARRSSSNSAGIVERRLGRSGGVFDASERNLGRSRQQFKQAGHPNHREIPDTVHIQQVRVMTYQSIAACKVGQIYKRPVLRVATATTAKIWHILNESAHTDVLGNNGSYVIS